MIDASPRRLQVFKTVVDLGGFNAAAHHLGIAQPSVGAHVTALERQAGHSLLRRQRGQRPELTEAGRAVYELASDVVRRSEQTAQLLAGLAARQSREIVIAVHRDLASSFLPPRLGRFSRTNPRSRVVTRIGTIEDVLALVRSQAVQLGVLLAAGPIRGVGSDVVGTEPLELVVAPAHPLVGRRALAGADLISFAFVTGLTNSQYFKFVDNALRSIGIRSYDIAFELQEATAVKEAVRHGRAIACLPRCVVGDELASGTLVALHLETSIEPLQIRCVYSATPNAAAAKLVKTLRGTGRS